MASGDNKFLWTVVVAALCAKALYIVSGDPDHLQDICVADLNSVHSPKMNGYACKTVALAEDFSSSCLSKAGPTNNTFGSTATAANVQNIPGLNTMGISMARLDYCPGGINPPHIHPRATETIFVLEGELEASFITTDNVIFSKIIKTGDVFVFPKALIHFQKNIGKLPAAAIAAFNSQNPGTQKLPATLFSAAMPNDVLIKSFHVDAKDVDRIKSTFAPKK